MLKTFVPFLASIVTIILLYTLGIFIDVEWLDFSYRNEYTTAEGRGLEVGGSILPIFIGLGVGFLLERIL
ncbi:hypothetical protein LCL89_09320 [Halobacillus yeomjeoni]|uniref:hypothetical protein n=1 Tax=Halobacillus yeomjeoni TaxID=311194 RepID=UPI001CD6758B|nr:hypothetical protein [Halobacillus yeomjeoni]MCA0984243.1 hypothetical protein [Halobacillus yeomjeoni]